jgi:hypothetical protein
MLHPWLSHAAPLVKPCCTPGEAMLHPWLSHAAPLEKKADRRWGQKDGSLDTESEEGAEGRSEKESVVRWMRLEKRREGRGSEKGEASQMVLIFWGSSDLFLNKNISSRLMRAQVSL